MLQAIKSDHECSFLFQFEEWLVSACMCINHLLNGLNKYTVFAASFGILSCYIVSCDVP